MSMLTNLKMNIQNDNLYYLNNKNLKLASILCVFCARTKDNKKGKCNMGTTYQLLAAHYPFMGYYEESFQCKTLWSAMMKFREYKHQGYEIIDMFYRG